MPARSPFRPRVAQLEDRTTPATLDLNGTALTLTLAAGDDISMTGTSTVLTFNAVVGTIDANPGAEGLGFTDGVASGPGSLATVTALTVVGVAGAETFRITTTGGTFPTFAVDPTVDVTNITAAAFDTGANGQSYGGPVALLANASLTGSGVAFNSTVDGAFDLNLTATAATFVGAVGGTTPLTALSVDTGTLAAAAVATTTGLSVTNTGAGAITGVISGAAGVTKNGTGTLTLGGANTYAGATNVFAGTLVAATPTALGTAAGNTFVSAGTVDVRADLGLEPFTAIFGTLVTSAGFTGVVGGPVTLAADVTVGGAGALTINGVMSGAGAVIKTGTGTVTLAGANTYTLPTDVTAGTLIVTNPTALGTPAGGTTVSSGATLNVRTDIGLEPLTLSGIGTAAGFGALRTSTNFTGVVGGPVTLAADTDIGGSGVLTINGVVGGAFNVTKTGIGDIILGAANTYTGLTTVNGGRLIVNGAVGPVTLAAGTLAGNGTVGVLTATAGTVAPAAGAPAAATLKAGNTALAAGSTFAPAVGPAGTTTGTLAVTGTVDVTGATLAPTSLAPAVAGQSFTLLDNDGTDAVVGTFAGLPQGATVNVGGQPFVISYTGGSGNDITLTAPLPVRAPVVAGGAANGTVAVLTPDAAGALGAPATVTVFPGGTTNVRTAAADVNGDGTADLVAATGPGVPLRVTVLSGVDNSVLVAPFAPFSGSEDFTGGGFVAAADLDGDGRAEFVVTPDQGGGPRVTIFSLAADNKTTTVRANFLGITGDPDFRGGVRPALGDVNGDGTPDLAVAAGFLGGPRVALFTGTSLLGGTPTKLINDFFAFPGTDATSLRNGSFVAIGDLNGDGFGDMIFGGGPGGAPRVFVLSGQSIAAGDIAGAYAAPVANFFVAGNTTDRGGIRVAAADLDGDLRDDLVVGSGEGRPARVRAYLGANFTSAAEPATFQDVDVFGGAVLAGGVFVG